MSRKTEIVFEWLVGSTIREEMRFWRGMACGILASMIIFLAFAMCWAGGNRERQAIKFEVARQYGYSTCCMDMAGIVENGGGIDQVLAFLRGQGETVFQGAKHGISRSKTMSKNKSQSKVKRGLFWHIHHEVLLEYSHNIDERIAYIKSDKPANEVELRLRLMKPVRGKLPKEMVEAWNALDEAGNALDEARNALDEARNAYNEARKALGEARNAYNEARKAFDEARKAYNEACNALDKTWKTFDEAIQRNLPAIMELHSKECPNCPWDGRTIFPK